MNIAIVIGISDYSTEHKIIAPQQDAIRVKRLLEATRKYAEILFLIKDTTAANVKNQIRSFLEKYQNKDIDEVFYYFSGHGKFKDKDFYMLCSDFSKTKLNMTSLTYSEIDDFIRPLNTKLTVKVVDACYSGYRYIKDDSLNSNIDILEDNTLKNCIFMFSSLENQESQMMGETSFFTEKFIEGALSAKVGNKILYRDIHSFIADEFISVSTQKPWFVTQCIGTEIFSEYNEEMQNLKDEWYSNNVEILENADAATDEKNINSKIVDLPNDKDDILEKINQILKEKDNFFVEKDTVKKILEEVKQSLSSYEIKDEIVNDLYQININWTKKLLDISKSQELLRKADDNEWSNKYLIKLNMKTIRKPIENPSEWETLLGRITREIQKPYSLTSSSLLPYEVIWIEFKPKKNLCLTPLLAIIGLNSSDSFQVQLEAY